LRRIDVSQEPRDFSGFPTFRWLLGPEAIEASSSYMGIIVDFMGTQKRNILGTSWLHSGYVHGNIHPIREILVTAVKPKINGLMITPPKWGIDVHSDFTTSKIWVQLICYPQWIGLRENLNRKLSIFP